MTLLSVMWRFVSKTALKFRLRFVTTAISQGLGVDIHLYTDSFMQVHSEKPSTFLSFQLCSSNFHLHILTSFFWEWKAMNQMHRETMCRQSIEQDSLLSTRKDRHWEEAWIRRLPQISPSPTDTCKIFTYVVSGLAKHGLHIVPTVTRKLYVLIYKFWH